MSTHLGRFGGRHDVDVDRPSHELVGASKTRFELCVDWPHLWQAGHSVTVRTTDECTFTGAVLAVSAVTKKVLIELL